jgi:hypothetical protein
MKNQFLSATSATLLMLFFLCLQPSEINAQIDTIHVKDKRLNTATLKPGMRQYLVSFQLPANSKQVRFWLWLRETQFANRNGEKVFVTRQNWYGSDSTSYRSVYSVNRMDDFLPIYHSELIAGKTRSYDWYADHIEGTDTVKYSNTQKDFSLNFATPNFNWNLDIETFEMLPLAAGKTFAINFYDAGSSSLPAYIIYKVIGSEILTISDNHKVDCWMLLNESDYKGQHATQTFWISKKGHEFLKEEDVFPGGYRYKVKLPQSSYDLTKRFIVKP